MGLSSIDIGGQIADLKETEYRNTLAISVLIELLAEKGLFTKQEFTCKAIEMEQSCLTDISRRMALAHQKFSKSACVKID